MRLNDTVKPANPSPADSDSRGLLYLLLDLISKISGQLAYRRTHYYYNHTPRHDCDALLSPMENLLEKLSAADCANSDTECIRTTYLCTSTSHRADIDQFEAPSGPVSTLSDYFKSRNNIMVLHPYLNEKLKAAVLENLHAAIRLTREHDQRRAQLHLQIARDATRELTHFLYDRELDTFYAQTIALTEQVAHYIHIDKPKDSTSVNNNVP